MMKVVFFSVVVGKHHHHHLIKEKQQTLKMMMEDEVSSFEPTQERLLFDDFLVMNDCLEEISYHLVSLR